MSASAMPIENVSWSGDLMRDTLIYRLIDISATLLDLVMENESAADHYQSWIEAEAEDLDSDDETQITPLVLTELCNEAGSRVLVLALPQPGQFVVVFTTPDFTSKVIVAQDYETAELQAASVTEFAGDQNFALVWSRDFIERVDEEMIAAGI